MRQKDHTPLLESHVTAQRVPLRPPRIEAIPWSATAGASPRILQLLSDREQKELASIATVVTIDRTTAPLFVAGNSANYLFSIDYGIVRVVREIVNGDRQIVAFMFPGDLVGLAESGAYINSAEPVTPCRLYRYPIKAFQHLLASDPLLELHLLVKASHELRSSQRILSIIAREPVYERLACFIALLMRQDGLYDDTSKQLVIPMTRFDIADYLAAAPETLARCFRQLEDLNKIQRVGARLIQIIDGDFFTAYGSAI